MAASLQNQKARSLAKSELLANLNLPAGIKELGHIGARRYFREVQAHYALNPFRENALAVHREEPDSSASGSDHMKRAIL